MAFAFLLRCWYSTKLLFWKKEHNCIWTYAVDWITAPSEMFLSQSPKPVDTLPSRIIGTWAGVGWGGLFWIMSGREKQNEIPRGMATWEELNPLLLALKIDIKGYKSRNVSGNRKGKGIDFLPKPPDRMQVVLHLEFSPVKLISDLWPPV